MRLNIFFLFLLLLPMAEGISQTILQKQDLVASLEVVDADKITYPTTHQPSIVESKFSADSSYGNTIFKYQLQPYQNIFSKYTNHKATLNEMKYAFNISKTRRLSFDTSKLSSKVLNNSLTFSIEIRQNGDIIMHPDTNNDNDFSNDTSVILGNAFEKRIKRQKISFSYRNIEMADNNNKIILVNPIITFAINEISDSTSNGLIKSLLKKNGWVKIIQNKFKIAKVKIDNRDYFMVVNASLAGNIYDESNLNTINITREILASNSACTVCQEDFKIGEQAKKLQCDHCFHEDCIMPWLRVQNTCPVCRSEV